MLYVWKRKIVAFVSTYDRDDCMETSCLNRVLSALVYNGHNLMGGGNTTIISCLIVGNAECSIQEFGEKRNRLKRKNVTKPLRH